ncbi:hypothetical protein A3Q56_08017 [Intoshia linei]|uniref:Uncharacterized protein n=1 Tax=Intoshia linei TaxID=1819745 RepID=A0A177ARY6_9BILA|nr:hypothetical protein A3Q56_08017 [Intoshia linei]
MCRRSMHIFSEIVGSIFTFLYFQLFHSNFLNLENK